MKNFKNLYLYNIMVCIVSFLTNKISAQTLAPQVLHNFRQEFDTRIV